MQEVEKELECMRREYEHVRREYEIGDTRGLPMSVRERYRQKLSKLRKKIQMLEVQVKHDIGVSAS